MSICSSESLETGELVVVPRKLLNLFLARLRVVVVDGVGVTDSSCSPESFEIVVAAVVVVARNRPKRLPDSEPRTVVGCVVLTGVTKSSRSAEEESLEVVARTVVVRTRLNLLPDRELRAVFVGVVLIASICSLESSVVVGVLTVVVRKRPKRFPDGKLRTVVVLLEESSPCSTESLRTVVADVVVV